MMFNFSCKDREDENGGEANFCMIQRNFDSEIANKEGVLLYLSDKKKYAIRHYPYLPTIDEVHYYILCDKPQNIKENDSVRFSCKLYRFNANEGFTPTVGGTEFYFVNNLNILKL